MPVTQNEPLSFRTLQRLALAATTLSTEHKTVSVEPITRPALAIGSRRARKQREAAARWRRVKWDLLDGLRALREQEEGGTLQAVDFRRASLFAVPSTEEVPPMPLWRGLHGERRPSSDDTSALAEEWRREVARRVEIVGQRRRARSAVQMRPGKCWPDFARGGERGGLLPEQRAYPGGWNFYLLRLDPDGLYGEGWNSHLGRAWKRIERVEGESRLARAVWLYTEPRRPENGVLRVMESLGVRRAQAYAWLDAGARRLCAEMTVSVGDKEHARSELREAEAAEAQAWALDARIEKKGW